jgi:hypothetical protein
MNTTQIVNNINKYITIDYVYIKNKGRVKIKPFSDLYTTLNPVILYGLSDVEKDIPTFNHPIVNLEHKWIALDLRPYVKVSDTREDYEVKNESEYTLALHRFVLSGLWYTGKQSSLYALKLGHFAFASWISDNLTRKFGLDLHNQLQLRILSFIYYSHLFNDDFTADDFTKLVIRGKEDVLIPQLIEEVQLKVSKLENIDDFCEACYAVTNNIRLKGLDYNVLVNILGTNWMGNNGKEMVLLATEHPPTWLSLVYASLTSRSFKKNYVTSVVDKLDKRGKGEEFINALSALTHEQME